MHYWESADNPLLILFNTERRLDEQSAALAGTASASWSRVMAQAGSERLLPTPLYLSPDYNMQIHEVSNGGDQQACHSYFATTAFTVPNFKIKTMSQ